ncbi:MAG: hypothetical protein JO247_07920 [Chloroflexi bacterium]|nr:hypothetical protein [Chloroflexota bacterium]
MSTAEIVRQWVAEGVYPEPRSSIEAATLGDWTVVVEEGFLASIPSVMRRLAAGSRALAMYRNVNAVMSLVWAVDGAIVRWFDPLLVDDRFGEPQAEEAGLPFGEPDLAEAAMFACGERLTSVRLTEAFLDDRLAWVAVGHDWMASSQHESYD